MQNKNYRLLKDLPFAKAGEIFESRILDDGKEYMFWGEIKIQNIKNFDEWFEEIPEPKWAYHINDYGDSISCIMVGSLPSSEHYLKKIDNYFETEEEAEKYLEYLKAKTIIKQDTKGFKPNWEDKDEDRFIGCWDFKRKRTRFDYGDAFKTPEIYFKSREDISESFKKHPEEWKAYLIYEQ